MSADQILLLQQAIQILGPAIITGAVGLLSGFIGYLTARSQSQIKLKELDKSNEFRAREHLFNLYKERDARLEKIIRELNKTFGKLLVHIDALQGDNNQSELMSFTRLILIYSRPIINESQRLKRQLQDAGLIRHDLIEELETHATTIRSLGKDHNVQRIQDDFGFLIEISNDLSYYNQLLLEHSINSIFKKYTD